MEYVINVYDLEKKESSWFKDGLVIFVVTNDILEAKRFESDIDAEKMKKELAVRHSDFFFYVTTWNHEAYKSRNDSDAVNHPKHYQDPSGIECIDIVRHRNFDVGNAIKYLWRAGLKQDADKTPIEKQIEDLRKAIWYIEDEIKTLESKKSKEVS